MCVCACVLSRIPEPVVTNSFEVPIASEARGDGLYPSPPIPNWKAYKGKSKQAVTPRMSKMFLHLWLQPVSWPPCARKKAHTCVHTSSASANDTVQVVDTEMI